MEKRGDKRIYIHMYVRKYGWAQMHTYLRMCVHVSVEKFAQPKYKCACVCDLRIKCVGGSVCAYRLLFFRCSFLYCDTTTTPQQFQQQQRVLAASLTLDFEA